jgi:hypothetical protein
MTELCFPVLLGGEESSIEVLETSPLLKNVPSLTIKKGSLINALVYEGDGGCYRIINIITLGRTNPWWKFEFGNPLMKVEITYVKENKSLSQMKDDILSGIEKYFEYWESASDFSTIAVHIRNANNLKDIISYLYGLVYRR